MSIDEVEDIYRFRFSIEKEAAGLAAKLHTPEQLKQMVYHLTSAKKAVTARDVEATIVTDTDFRIAILDGGRCNFAASLYRANRPTIDGALRSFILLTGPLAPSSSPSSICMTICWQQSNVAMARPLPPSLRVDAARSRPDCVWRANDRREVRIEDALAKSGTQVRG